MLSGHVGGNENDAAVLDGAALVASLGLVGLANGPTGISGIPSAHP